MKLQLITVSEASRDILKSRTGQVYTNIRRGIYPPGVVVFLSEKSIRFNRSKLMAWVESGGAYRKPADYHVTIPTRIAS